MGSKFVKIKVAVGTVLLLGLQPPHIPSAAWQSRGGAPCRHALQNGVGVCVPITVFKHRLCALLWVRHWLIDAMATDVPIPGLGSIENPYKFKDQDFKKILEACLKSGKLFSDPAFPAEQQSIGMPEDPDPEKAIQWLRPKVGSPERIPDLGRSRIVCPIHR